MNGESRMFGQPRLHLFDFVHPQVIPDDVDRHHRRRETVSSWAFLVRVSKAANRFGALHRPDSCSTKVGRSFVAALVGDLRGRGCKLLSRSTPGVRAIARLTKSRQPGNSKHLCAGGVILLGFAPK